MDLSKSSDKAKADQPAYREGELEEILGDYLEMRTQQTSDCSNFKTLPSQLEYEMVILRKKIELLAQFERILARFEGILARFEGILAQLEKLLVRVRRGQIGQMILNFLLHISGE